MDILRTAQRQEGDTLLGKNQVYHVIGYSVLNYIVTTDRNLSLAFRKVVMELMLMTFDDQIYAPVKARILTIQQIGAALDPTMVPLLASEFKTFFAIESNNSGFMEMFQCKKESMIKIFEALLREDYIFSMEGINSFMQAIEFWLVALNPGIDELFTTDCVTVHTLNTF